MGRKRKENAYRNTISIKITDNQKELLKKNEWIYKEIVKNIRDYLNVYLDSSQVRK